MKKLLSLVLSLAMVLTMAVPVLAAEINEGSTNNSGTTNVTYTVNESYVVTIPDSMTVGASATVSASNVTLAEGTILTVSVSSTQYENGWKLKNHDDTLGYTMKINEVDIINFDTVLSAKNGEEVSKTLVTAIVEEEKPKYSGTYKDILTFQVEVKDVYSYDATFATADELKEVVIAALNYGWRNLSIQLSSNAGAGMTQAIARGMVEAGVAESSVTLTLSGIECIPARAFRNTISNTDGYGLKSLYMPDATSMEQNAFCECSSLESINLPKMEIVDNLAFSKCANLKEINLPEATTIREMAFNYCTNLETISLPKVMTIEVGAFENCTELKSVSLPKVMTVGRNAFGHCENLTSVSLLNATMIGAGAFARCTRLTTVSLPKVTNIGEMAFESNHGLELILTAEDAIVLGENIFTDFGYAEDYSYNMDLVLNENKRGEVTNGNTWNGYTFKSITFLTE